MINLENVDNVNKKNSCVRIQLRLQITRHVSTTAQGCKEQQGTSCRQGMKQASPMNQSPAINLAPTLPHIDKAHGIHLLAPCPMWNPAV